MKKEREERRKDRKQELNGLRKIYPAKAVADPGIVQGGGHRNFSEKSGDWSKLYNIVRVQDPP